MLTGFNPLIEYLSVNSKKAVDISLINHPSHWQHKSRMVEGDGFEPSKAVPADLQSAPLATREPLHIKIYCPCALAPVHIISQRQYKVNWYFSFTPLINHTLYDYNYDVIYIFRECILMRIFDIDNPAGCRAHFIGIEASA